GIRDFHVTGVQTCALPIWRSGEKKSRLVGAVDRGIPLFPAVSPFLWTGLLMTAVNFCAGAFLPMILPFVTERLGGSSAEYGLYMAAYPLGFMLGALYTGWIGEPSDRRRRMLGALFFQGGCMVLPA